MLSTLKSDKLVYVCLFILMVLLWYYHKTKDKGLIYFILSDVFYIIGEVCFDTFERYINVPVDFIFFLLFYLSIFCFFKQRTKILMKNPMFADNTKIKTWILFIIDYLIIFIFSFLIYYYFDCSAGPLTPYFNFNIFAYFLYPILDFSILSYYVNINKKFIISDRKIYLPLIAGILIWAISDFLVAYEEMFNAPNYGIGEYMQGVGFAILIPVLMLVKSSRTDSYYTTIDIYKDNSKLGNYSLLMTLIVFFYITIYIYCLHFMKDFTFMNIINEFGVILLVLYIIRQNLVYYDIQSRLNKLSKDAGTDPLTGLFSRKYAFTLMQRLYKSSVYFKMKISVLMVDIDRFKNFNDTYGHMNGDRVLKDIAQLINKSIETSNIICRYGGEEFMIVLPGIDKNNGMMISEKIREKIDAYEFNACKVDSVDNVTVSIGGATANERTNNEIDLVKEADMALYKAKESRNKCLWYN